MAVDAFHRTGRRPIRGELDNRAIGPESFEYPAIGGQRILAALWGVDSVRLLAAGGHCLSVLAQKACGGAEPNN